MTQRHIYLFAVDDIFLDSYDADTNLMGMIVFEMVLANHGVSSRDLLHRDDRGAIYRNAIEVETEVLS